MQGGEGAEWKKKKPAGGLDRPGVPESYVFGVWTPAKLPHFSLQFAGEITAPRTDKSPRLMASTVRTARPGRL